MTKQRTDYTEESGCVMPCALCSHRIVTDTTAEAWRRMYRHLRDDHRSEHAARMADTARKTMQAHQRK